MRRKFLGKVNLMLVSLLASLGFLSCDPQVKYGVPFEEPVNVKYGIPPTEYVESDEETDEQTDEQTTDTADEQTTEESK